MLELGKINTLRIEREVDFGAYLDGGEIGEILIPAKYLPEDYQIDDYLDVFVYKDSEDRLIATTEEPYAEVGDFAFLKVKSVNNVGAFMDWGLLKDLLVPYSEQRNKLVEGTSRLVYIYLDQATDRIVGSTKIDKFLDNIPPDYEEGQEVDLIIGEETDLGVKVIINKSHTGLLYRNEIFQPIKPGQKIKGFIKKLREDEKIDVALQQQGYQAALTEKDQILQKLKSAGGFLEVNDKSSPEQIKHMFGISKKVFKKAIGALYKEREITIEQNGIRLK